MYTMMFTVCLFVCLFVEFVFILAIILQRCPHLACVGIHGDMAQQRRSEILKGFLEGKYSAIVATGVLARGLDLKNVQQVSINIIMHKLCILKGKYFVEV